MSALNLWRAALGGLIPRGFLRRAQGEALFVSDYPRFGSEGAVSAAIREAGFAVTVSAGLAHIDALPEAYETLLRNLPPADCLPTDETLFLYALARRLERSAVPFSFDHIPMIRAVLKYLDANDLPGLYRFLSPAAASAQRIHAPLPAALGRLILNGLAGTGEHVKSSFSDCVLL